MARPSAEIWATVSATWADWKKPKVRLRPVGLSQKLPGGVPPLALHQQLIDTHNRSRPRDRDLGILLDHMTCQEQGPIRIVAVVLTPFNGQRLLLSCTLMLSLQQQKRYLFPCQRHSSLPWLRALPEVKATPADRRVTQPVSPVSHGTAFIISVPTAIAVPKHTISNMTSSYTQIKRQEYRQTHLLSQSTSVITVRQVSCSIHLPVSRALAVCPEVNQNHELVARFVGIVPQGEQGRDVTSMTCCLNK